MRSKGYKLLKIGNNYNIAKFNKDKTINKNRFEISEDEIINMFFDLIRNKMNENNTNNLLIKLDGDEFIISKQ